MSYYGARRPGILGPITFFSFLLSFLNVLWVIAVGVIAAVAGVASFVLGPVGGALGALVAVIVILFMVAQSFLSILLFSAAWRTWSGDIRGRSLHLLWAWIIVIVDLLDLAFTGGIDGGAWVRLIYAGLLILIMNRDDVRAYFDEGGRGPGVSKAYIPDDWST